MREQVAVACAEVSPGIATKAVWAWQHSGATPTGGRACDRVHTEGWPVLRPDARRSKCAAWGVCGYMLWAPLRDASIRGSSCRTFCCSRDGNRGSSQAIRPSALWLCRRETWELWWPGGARHGAAGIGPEAQNHKIVGVDSGKTGAFAAGYYLSK